MFGQTATPGDYGFTSEVDKKDECKVRFVALNAYVFDDANVAPTDEISITVSAQEKMTEKELEYIEIPEVPDLSFKGDPQALFEEFIA